MKYLFFHRRNYYVFLISSILLYIGLAIFGPKGPNRYNLSTTQIVLLQLTIVTPIIIAWLAAIFGAVRFRAYAETIKKSPDGKAVKEVSQGLLILAVGLIVTGLFSGLRQIMFNNGHATAFGIINNYLAVGFAVSAFYKLFKGSKKLLAVKRISRPPGASQTLALIGGVIVSTLYVVAVLNAPYRNHTPDPQTYNSYFLPDWLIVVTIIAPYVFSWFIGILAALNIWSYNVNTKGTLYKLALSNLVKGILAVTFFSISIQFLTAMATSLQNLELSSILAIIYVIIIFYALGYLLIFLGAKKLARIEEV